VSLAGAGGKTSVARLLADELAAAGGRVVVTTTTAMMLAELEAVGTLVIDADDALLSAGLSKALHEGRVAGAARALGADGKVVGLPPATVDRLWRDGLADYVIVEADGSRGLPLKAFGPHEPQVPGATTTTVVVAGLDAMGTSLDAAHVHRVGALTAALRLPISGTVTFQTFVGALREQVRQVRQTWPASRIVALLNKADDSNAEALGSRVAMQLLTRAADADHLLAPDDRQRPDAVVVASLRRGRFVRVPDVSR
jgi:probable selenium-dependent hydroxylase accessory protein YqeC